MQNDAESPLKREFSNMKLKQQIDPETEFLIDLRKVGSPQKTNKIETHKQSKALDLAVPANKRESSQNSASMGRDLQEINNQITKD